MPAEIKKEIELEIGHVLFIDIVGYSKLLIDEQRDYLHTLNEVVRRTDSFRAADAAGKLTRLPTGDGMALVFATTPDAPVSCAIEISNALRSHPELRVRMGIHSGPVSGTTDVNDRSNVAGAGINLAQRVMDCGDAGHILLSKRVAEDLEQYRQWRSHLHDLGECEVKHDVRVHVVNLYTDELGNRELPEKFQQAKATLTAPPTSAPVAKPAPRSRGLIAALIIVAALAAVAGFYISSRRTGPKAPPSASAPAPAAVVIPEKSIAVLPYENLSSDKENAYFADGIQDEILTRVSKIADLKVISRTSTQHYKSAPDNLPKIARQLGVAHILEGSVQKSGDAVRVNVQLIKAANESHLWADTFDRKLTDIFSVESEVAKAIAEQLRAKLTGQEEQVITAKPTDNPEAYDAYLRGLAYTLKSGANTPVNALAAQKYLKEAERLDPRDVDLLSQHALSYIELRRFPEALRKLDQVLNIVPDDLDTLAFKAAIAQAEGDLPRAAALLAPLHPAADDTNALETQVYQAILERNPGPMISRLNEVLAKPDPALGYFIGELRFWLGWAQEVAGDHAAAHESWRQARGELEPFLKEQPENRILIGDLALTNMGLGDKAAAFELIDRGMDAVPIKKDSLTGPGTIEILARVAARMGEPDRA